MTWPATLQPFRRSYLINGFLRQEKNGAGLALEANDKRYCEMNSVTSVSESMTPINLLNDASNLIESTVFLNHCRIVHFPTRHKM